MTGPGGVMNLKMFRISQTQLETGRDETRLCEVSRRRDFGVKMSWESWFRRDICPKICRAAKTALGGVDACPEKGGRGGLGVNPDHPSQPKTRTGCGWGKGGNTKGGSEVKSFPLLLAPPNPPRATPLLTSYDAQTLGRVSAVVAGKFQVSRTSKFSNLTTSKASTTISTSTLD